MTDPEVLQTLFHTPEVPCHPRMSSVLASRVMSPPNALIVPQMISSDVPIGPHADVLVTHPHVVAPIGGSEVTSWPWRIWLLLT